MRTAAHLRVALLASLVLPAAARSEEEGPAKGPAGPSRVYKTVDGRELKLWVLRPDGMTDSDRRPAVVFFHGGGWVGGGPAKLEPQARYFASRGLVTVLVEYRLLPRRDRTPPTVCVQDAKSAMRWVRSHAAELGVDPDRIASAGGSAGGHLAAAVSLLPGLDDPQDDPKVSPHSNAMILLNPVFDNGPGQWGHDRVGDRYREFSPAHNVGPGAPPAVVLLGDRDRLIPVGVAERFRAAMDKAGARCDVHIYPGQGHGFFNKGAETGDGRYYLETLREADRFLASLGWLQGPPTLPAADATTRPAR